MTLRQTAVAVNVQGGADVPLRCVCCVCGLAGLRRSYAEREMLLTAQILIRNVHRALSFSSPAASKAPSVPMCCPFAAMTSCGSSAVQGYTMPRPWLANV